MLSLNNIIEETWCYLTPAGITGQNGHNPELTIDKRVVARASKITSSLSATVSNSRKRIPEISKIRNQNQPNWDHQPILGATTNQFLEPT